MNIVNSLNRFCSKSVVSPVLLIWLTLVSLFGKCSAQDGGIGFTIPLIFMIAGCSLFCCCFWLCFTAICYSQQQKNKNTAIFPPSNTATTQYTFNLQRNQDYSKSQSEASESVSLHVPEATLHQGDAPPAYDEAIGIKTVNHAVV